MSADRERLERLRRIERVRAIAKQMAANEAAEAEGTLGQLMALRDRTHSITLGYDPMDRCADAGALQRMGSFLGGVNRINAQTEQEIVAARQQADAKQAQLAAAERRRSLAGSRVEDARRHMRREKMQPCDAKRKNWHAS